VPKALDLIPNLALPIKTVKMIDFMLLITIYKKNSLVIDHLPGMCKVLDSIPNQENKKRS
jgi:hypothetical protein